MENFQRMTGLGEQPVKEWLFDVDNDFPDMDYTLFDDAGEGFDMLSGPQEMFSEPFAGFVPALPGPTPLYTNSFEMPPPPRFSPASMHHFSPGIPSVYPPDTQLPQMQNTLLISPGEPAARPTRIQRNAGGPLDWDTNRPKIKDYYVDHRLPLDQTMERMKAVGFDASVKDYKTHFKKWGWHKNLSKVHKAWMLARAEKRKRDDNKDTLFKIGDREWDLDRLRGSIKRINLDQLENARYDAPTPVGVHYYTPSRGLPSPSIAMISPRVAAASFQRWTPVPGSQLSVSNRLQTTWNNLTRADIEKLFEQAQALDREGSPIEAETVFRNALAGYQNLLGPTHDGTSHVGYSLAAFYAKHNRIKDAHSVVNWMCDKFVKRWGICAEQTAKHVFRIAEMLRNWSLEDDAMVLIQQLIDAHQQRSDHKNFESTVVPEQVTDLGTTSSAPNVASPLLLIETDDPILIDYQLGIIRTRLKNNEEAAEVQLVQLIDQCQRYPMKLSVQYLKAQGLLICHYKDSNSLEKASTAFDGAEQALYTLLHKSERCSAGELEASIHLTRFFVENEQYKKAKELFFRIEKRLVKDLGEDDDTTVDLLIEIAKIYQEQNRWNDARLRLEQALAASMAAKGLRAGLTKHLERALENRHLELYVPPTKQGWTTLVYPMLRNEKCSNCGSCFEDLEE